MGIIRKTYGSGVISFDLQRGFCVLEMNIAGSITSSSQLMMAKWSKLDIIDCLMLSKQALLLVAATTIN